MDNDVARRNRFVNSWQSKKRLGLTWLEIAAAMVCTAILVALLLPATGSRRPSRRSECMSNLKQICLALHAYHEAYRVFPPAYTVDSKGKRLHSWRTLILPGMDELRLYKSIDLTKPWDDPANLAVAKKTPAFYRCPSFSGQQDQTTYLAIVTDASCLRPGKSCSLSEITDDPAQTMVIIEAPNDKSVHWMSPNDADEQMTLGLGATSKLAHKGLFQVALADLRVQSIPLQTSAQTLRALITIDGGEKIFEF